ncbi:hypothetical protein IWW40_005804 [Coemansia sp. RSA 1250]|nr:hypothetical protein IWW40_005804 [Coemansia sp. RSA 1250]
MFKTVKRLGKKLQSLVKKNKSGLRKKAPEALTVYTSKPHLSGAKFCASQVSLTGIGNFSSDWLDNFSQPEDVGSASADTSIAQGLPTVMGEPSLNSDNACAGSADSRQYASSTHTAACCDYQPGWYEESAEYGNEHASGYTALVGFECDNVDTSCSYRPGINDYAFKYGDEWCNAYMESADSRRYTSSTYMAACCHHELGNEMPVPENSGFQSSYPGASISVDSLSDIPKFPSVWVGEFILPYTPPPQPKRKSVMTIEEAIKALKETLPARL